MKAGASRRPGGLVLGALAAVGVFASACGSSTEPLALAPLPPTGPAYSILMSGDVRAAVQGVPTSVRAASGYREVTATGIAETTAVVLVTFKPGNGSEPSLIVGLMGPIQTGTFTLRSTGSVVPGSRPEYYGVLTQLSSGGTRNFNATSGTVTLTAVGDTLRGTFTLHYGSVVLVPPNAPAGAKYTPTDANVDATGTFVVPVPTVTVP